MRETIQLIPLWLRRGVAVAMVCAIALVSVSAAHEPPRPKLSDLANPVPLPLFANTELTLQKRLQEQLQPITREQPGLNPIVAPTRITPAPRPQLTKPVVTIKGPHLVWMEVTAYCSCTKCCGPKATGLTASGKLVTYNASKFVAADSSFAFGTKLRIPGYHDGQPVEVIDRGGAIKGNHIDVFFSNHEDAKK